MVIKRGDAKVLQEPVAVVEHLKKIVPTKGINNHPLMPDPAGSNRRKPASTVPQEFYEPNFLKRLAEADAESKRQSDEQNALSKKRIAAAKRLRAFARSRSSKVDKPAAINIENDGAILSQTATISSEDGALGRPSLWGECETRRFKR